MATIFVLDQQNQQVGSVNFIFSREPRQSYLFVDIDANYAASFQLQESTVLNAAGKAIASLWCGSNGKDVKGEVAPFGRYLPNIGLIQGAKAQVMEASGLKVLGGVTQKYVRSELKGVMGELSMHWGSEDEEFYQHNMKMFADHANLPPERAPALIERLRPVMYQNMINLAGCAALIMKLFDKKKGGWFG